MGNGNCLDIASEWRKSSYSWGNGNCVDIAAEWRKSSYSHATGNCQDIATGWRKSDNEPVVYMADTTEGTGFERTVLEFTPGAWKAFLARLR
jgi:hypothetical protein